MKRLIALILISVFTLSAVSCASGNIPSETDNTTTVQTSVTEQPVDTSEIIIAPSENAAYRIVLPVNANAKLVYAAGNLRDSIKTATGLTVEIIRDDAPEAPGNRNIWIGNVSVNSLTDYISELKPNDRRITAIGSDILIAGGSTNSTVAAVSAFSETYIAEKDKITVPYGVDEIYRSQEQEYIASEHIGKLKINGRYSISGNSIICDWSGSGIEFNADCEGKVTVSVFVAKSGSWYTGDTYYTVYIDGVRSETRLSAKLGLNELVVAEGLTRGVHNIRLAKQSHAVHSLTSVSEIRFENGYLTDRPADNKYYIEFIGDSITCGYGVLGGIIPSVSGEGYGNSYYCDATQTYAYLASDKVGADCSFVSISGSFLTHEAISIYMEKNNKSSGTCVPDEYKYYNSRRDNKLYDFENSRKPDVIVINLGTNDFSYLKDASFFAAGIRDFVADLRSINGETTPIVWVCNMMNDGFQDTVKSVFAELGGESAGLFTVIAERDRTGLSSHPKLGGQTAAADLLADILLKKVFSALN